MCLGSKPLLLPLYVKTYIKGNIRTVLYKKAGHPLCKKAKADLVKIGANAKTLKSRGVLSTKGLP